MGKINILDQSVATLIAAGEVIERPASVIKELIENSIDAGATAITIEIKNGGISHMRVTDNGCGIEEDDIGIAFMRHSTSKIKNADDLYKITTLGFRGEALCSVASVSKVTLTTKTQDARNAISTIVEGGEMQDVFETGAPDGTTIVVENLFYNTPARMKFLKKDTTEAGYIKDVVERFILIHPEISYTFINNAKKILFSPGDGSLESAVYTVYGASFAKGILPVSYSENKITVEGCIGKSELSRPNRNFQSIYVNNRYIKNKTVTAAIEEGYKNQLMNGKFAFAVLNIKADPLLLDVNVHPNKLEVKFSDEKSIFNAVYWAVKNTLYQKPIVPEVTIKQKPVLFNDIPTYTQSKIEDLKKEQINIDKSQEDEYIPDYKPVSYDIPVSYNNMEKKLLSFKDSGITEYKTILDKNKKTEENKTEPAEDYSDYKVVGVLFNTYIIVQLSGKMLLIDQHAAHERLCYERLKKELDSGKVMSQMLLTPVVVELSGKEASAAKESFDFFNKIGFEVEEFGYNAIVIRLTPVNLPPDQLRELFLELLEVKQSGKQEIITNKQQRAIYTIACKAAIKANHEMKAEEINKLVEDIFTLKNINTCPHGRPIMISMSKYELEKQFKRIV